MISNNKNKRESRKRTVMWVILGIETFILAALLILVALNFDCIKNKFMPSTPIETVETVETTETVEAVPENTTLHEEVTAAVEEMEDTEVYLDRHLKIVNVGSYVGAYMEDGSDEIVSDILMLIVTNFSNKDIQYAEITLPTENGDAKFSVSTLPAGESTVLLELNRMEYSGKEVATNAVVENVAIFAEPLLLQEEALKLQVMDGALNVTNISGADIDSDIVIYYKNAASDLYYGGITYRVRLEGGMKAEEIKQITAKHFSDSGSKIMFVTIG